MVARQSARLVARLEALKLLEAEVNIEASKKRGYDTGDQEEAVPNQDEKKPGPRRKKRALAPDVLSLSSMPDSKLQIYKENGKTRLLDLPAETRNQIWEYVLGGKRTVHIWGNDRRSRALGKDRKLCRSICTREESEQEDANDIKKSVQEAMGTTAQSGYHERHQNCAQASWSPGRENPKESMDLQLLQICRQIHEEAALIPYQENCFSFNWVIELKAFVWHLIPTQVFAVQHLSFVFHSFKSTPTFTQEIGERVSGLKSFIAFVQFHSPNTEWDGVIDRDFMSVAKYKSLTTDSMLSFRQLSYDSATVAACNSQMLIEGYHTREGQFQNHVISQWAADMEKQLMDKSHEDEKIQEGQTSEKGKKSGKGKNGKKALPIRCPKE